MNKGVPSLAQPEKDKNEVAILVVDDEPGMREFLSFELEKQGYQVMIAQDGVEAVGLVKQRTFRLVMSDLKMPRMDGLMALEEIKKIDPNLEVIMMTGYGTIEDAVCAMKKGAYDFVQKPFNVEEIFMLVERALERQALKGLVSFYDASQVIFSTVKVEELVEIVMDLIQKVLRADEGSLMLLDQDNKLYVAASRGIQEEIARNVHLRLGESVAGRAADLRKEFLLVGGLENYPEFQDLGGNSRIRSSIVYPIQYQNELLGVLNLNRTTHDENFTTTDLKHVSLLASQLAQAIQNAKLYQSLEKRVEELRRAYRTLEETQIALVESERLAAVGRLVAGVAHEINNPLTAVIGYTQLLIEVGGIQGEAAEHLNIVFNEAQRCRQIVQDLLAFARKKKLEAMPVNSCEILDEAIQALSLEFERSQIIVTRKYPDSFPNIYADPAQIRQVFSNILQNACQALSSVKSGAKKIDIEVVQEGNQLRHFISDNGPGIPKEHLNKVFDPFFTTKEVGKGTGLGLSLSYGIVKEHGGHLSVQSETGKGAKFIIDFMLSPEPVREAPVYNPSQRQETWSILLVEDEEAIATLLARLLMTKGFKVERATDGSVALEKVREKDYDIIVCDYVMPKMNGRLFFQKVREFKPGLTSRFIFITGSVMAEDMSVFFKEFNLPCLVKPFSGAAFLKVIEDRIQSLSKKSA